MTSKIAKLILSFILSMILTNCSTVEVEEQMEAEEVTSPSSTRLSKMKRKSSHGNVYEAEDYGGEAEYGDDELNSAAEYDMDMEDIEVASPLQGTNSLNSPGKLYNKDRKVHYDAAVEIEVKDPKQTISESISLARSLGGYVESQTLTNIVLQIPVKEFFKTYEACLKLGKVISKNLYAEDITE